MKALVKKLKKSSTKKVATNNLDPYRTLINNPYYTEIMTLNYKPLNWVHDDWLDAIPLIDNMRALGTPKIQRAIFQQLGLRSCVLDPFDDPLKRLIFLPNQSLLQLAAMIGLSCFQAQLSLLIEKNVRQALCQQLGIHSLKMLQSKLQFMIAKYPESLKCKLPLLDLTNNTVRLLYPYGINLMAASTDGPSGLWSQFLLRKLPKVNNTTLTTITLTTKEHVRLRLLIQKIALEFVPKCTTLLK